MRLSPIAVVIAAFFASGFVPIPAVGAALPQLALACSSAAAGQPASCTVTRVSGGQGIYVLFKTADGTAKAGTDYTATSQLVYLKGGDKSASVAVPTAVNPAAAGTLTFNAAISAGVTVVKASGSIVEPAAPPAPTPPPAPSPGPLAIGGTATVIAAEQAVPKVAASFGYTYGEANYRTVQPGETVKLGLSFPDVGCACAGQRRSWSVYALDGTFIGYLWEDNLTGVAPSS